MINNHRGVFTMYRLARNRKTTQDYFNEMIRYGWGKELLWRVFVEERSVAEEEYLGWLDGTKEAKNEHLKRIISLHHVFTCTCTKPRGVSA